MPRPIVRLIAIATLAAPALAGCAADGAVGEALHAKRALVGMSKQTLLSCAGVPERQATADGQEFFTYTSGRIVSTPGSYPGRWGWPYWGPGWGWPAYAPEVRSYACEATFTLADGVVRQVVYSGGSSAGQCVAIVANCLDLVGPPPAAPAR